MAALTIDAAGARAASLEENRRDLNDRQQEAFGADLALSPQTPQAQWSGILALALAELGEAGVRAALYGSSIDHAPGAFLDALGSLLDIRRRAATRSRVTVTVSGAAGTGLPAGSRAKTIAAGDHAGGNEFETLQSVVLSPAGIQVDMQAVETGPVAAPAGTLTRIVTVIAGWETITNPAAAALGIDRESDDVFRRSYQLRTAHSSIGALSSLAASLEEALAGRQRVAENNDDAPIVLQEWTIGPHAILVFSEAGSDGDVTRAVENHRGMGTGTMSAIRGGAPDDGDLAGISGGAITWNGTEYTGLDLSSDADGAARAASLTALLADDPIPPAIAFIRGRYIAQFRWRPDRSPNFGDNSTSQAFGLDPDHAAYPAGPFLRPVERALAAAFTLARQPGFPADGLMQVRENVLARVAAYGIGEQVWANDLLCEAERVPGTRIRNFSVTAGGVAISGVAVPLDTLWSLAAADLQITVE